MNYSTIISSYNSTDVSKGPDMHPLAIGTIVRNVELDRFFTIWRIRDYETHQVYDVSPIGSQSPISAIESTRIGPNQKYTVSSIERYAASLNQIKEQTYVEYNDKIHLVTGYDTVDDSKIYLRELGTEITAEVKHVNAIAFKLFRDVKTNKISEMDAVKIV